MNCCKTIKPKITIKTIILLTIVISTIIYPCFCESLIEQIEKVSESIDKNPKQAIEQLEELLQKSQQNNDTKAIIESHINIGLAYLQLDKYEQTMKHFQDSYKLSLENNFYSQAGHSKNGYGMVWLSLGDYTKAMQSFQKSIEYFEKVDDKQGKAYASSNLGSVYYSLGNYDLSLENYLLSARINEELNNQEEIATNYNNIGTLHSEMNNSELAFNYFSKAVEIFTSLNDEEGLAYTYTNLGNFFFEYDYKEEAYKFYLKALTINTKLDNKNDLAQSFNNVASVLESNKEYDEAYKYYEYALKIYKELNNLEGIINSTNNLGTIEYRRNNLENALEFHTAAYKASKELKYNEGLESAIHNLSMDYQALGKPELALDFKSLYIELQQKTYSDKQSENIANAQIVYETEKKDADILKKASEIEAQKAKIKKQFIMLVIALIVGVIITALSYLIYKERQKSEKLLLNILPKKVADDLKKYGKTEPENFENCSVYFSDIVSFTSTSENLEPKYLIDELSDMFTTFDGIMDKYGCERIKTIGDAYMAVSGMPTPDENHAENMIDAALDILEALEERAKTSEIKWRIRIGINSGKIVGGVVGVKKYLYDVFGDAINTASRMESNSEPMRLNISPSTYELVKDKKDKYIFTERTPIEVKGKGEIKMYFVNRQECEIQE